ncbi:MAG: extracellular solute-binding protein [Oscillospiraceae bacterium]|nr:extracellular solute-binding protein [Oscillospiraceae bacterium]
MAGLLAGCGGGGGGNVNNGEPNTNTEQTEFDVISGISALSSGYDDNPVLNQMMENAGIKINWETMSDSLAEQVNIRLSAGGDQLPDAVQAVGWSNYDLGRYGRGGTFLDLTPYVTDPEVMPNLSAILERYPKIKAAITQDDGKIYGLPAAEMMGTAATGASDDYSIHSIQQFSMINKAWLDDLGLAVPETVEELKTALQAFKDNDMAAKMYGNDPGSTIPMSFGFDQWCWGQNIFYAPFGLTNWSDVCMDLRLTKDKEVVFDCVSDEYRNAITYYHDWYADGLIDVEVFSQDDKQYLSKCAQGKVGVATWWEISELMGDYAKDYVYLPPLKGPDGTCTVTIKSAGSAVNSGQLSITKACESPINLLKFYDQWYTGENVMQLQYGPIGVYFNEEKDAEGMYVSITDDEAHEKFNKSAGELKSASEVAGPKLILSDYYTNVFHMEDRAMQRLEDLQNFWFKYVDDFTFYPVDCVFTEDELNDLDLYRPDFESHVSEQEALWFRDGGPTDAEWEAYKQELVDTYGMDQILKVYQDAYERYTAAE